MSWYKKIWTPKSFVIVFLHFEGSQPVISALKIGKKVDVSDIDDPQLFENIEELVKFYGKSTPYHLHVLGTGVLSRKISDAPNFKDDLIINGNVEEFNFTTYNDGQSIVASFFRTEIVAPYLQSLKALKVHLIGISSGEAPLFSLLEENEHVSFDYTISKKEGNIDAFVRNETISKRTLYRHNYFSKPQLLAVALYSNYLNPDENYISSDDKIYKAANEEYIQYAQFKFYGISVLSILFVAVFSNYFYQNHLNDSIAQLELELSISNENLSLLERLEQEKSRKLQLVQNAGVNSPRFMSFYLDEIGRTTPKMVNLTDLQLYPITSKLKNKQRVEVDNTSIVVYGVTNDNEVLDNWIEKLDEFEWVKSVELMNYLKNEEGRADFKFTIALNQ